MENVSQATIKEVARAAGVSKGAVSLALNDRPGVSTATRQRILDVAADLGWSPNPRARALAVRKALAVGLVVARPPDVLRADAFFPAFISGLERVLSARGHALLLMVAEHDDEETYRALARERRVDGVLVTDLRVDDARPALLAELGLPCVVVAPPCVDQQAPILGVDDAPGIRAAVGHLVALGHTRIAHVAGPQSLVHGVSRRRAWAEALAEAGLPEGPCLEADFSAASGAEATDRLLDLAERPSAIVFANDLMATAGLAVAGARGLSVPRDLSITGFDDIELSAHLQPPLTTVTTGVVEWGAAAADQLLALIDGEPSAPPHLPSARLVVRGSTGPPPRP